MPPVAAAHSSSDPADTPWDKRTEQEVNFVAETVMQTHRAKDSRQEEGGQERGSDMISSLGKSSVSSGCSSLIQFCVKLNLLEL